MKCTFFVDDRLYNADPLTEFPKNEYDWKHLKWYMHLKTKLSPDIRAA